MRLISHIFIGFSRYFDRSRKLIFTGILSTLLLVANNSCFAEPLVHKPSASDTPVGRQSGSAEFTPEQMLSWQVKEFDGLTRYELAEDAGQTAVRAISKSSASGLFYETEIDLNKTPYLSWRWRVDRFPDLADEQVKDGDDFAARIYIVVNDGWTFFSTKAISYVWSGQSPAGTSWPNPFAGRSAMMVSVRQHPAGDQWFTEKRNLKADLKRLFGKEIETVKAIAIMTDTDNSGSEAQAWYGGLVFSAQ